MEQADSLKILLSSQLSKKDWATDNLKFVLRSLL